MSAYYNEIDPFAAQWLRNLIQAGHIAPGDVDERSIVDVRADDLRGYTQCHFFAGIGGWSYALRLAGWPDDKPGWTGSCPCQPFSSAGKGRADEDDRHLAPTWLRLIGECRPSIVFGEQVGAAIRVGWLDALFTEMEQMQYACGAVDFTACSVGAPHIRQRLYFVADALPAGRPERWSGAGDRSIAWSGGIGELADPNGRNTSAERQQRSGEHRQQPQDGGVGELGDTDPQGSQGLVIGRDGADQRTARPASLDGFWSNAEWIACRDGKARPVEPGTFPLVNGASSRVGRLRAYGNCIVAPQAAEFVRAVMDTGTEPSLYDHLHSGAMHWAESHS